MASIATSGDLLRPMVHSASDTDRASDPTDSTDLEAEAAAAARLRRPLGASQFAFDARGLASLERTRCISVLVRCVRLTARASVGAAYLALVAVLLVVQAGCRPRELGTSRVVLAASIASTGWRVHCVVDRVT